MPMDWYVLVTSSNLEHRRSLMRILEELPLNVISVSTLEQAEEVLSRQPIRLVFCDRRLPDGSYRDLLEHAGSWRHASRVVVTSETSDTVDQLEAAEWGASGIVRYPFHATDVELLILRAAREVNQEVTRA
ncbi:MAG TPA: response regulator [Candidatus Acidoferrum sp.]|jgi:DNA-binding NtrC family response regulator|nr:response regulator [Candidatus Acidoferrum sp.]